MGPETTSISEGTSYGGLLDTDTDSPNDYVGTEGEPFIALNEIGIVFAESPKVIGAFDTFRSERVAGNPLAPSLTDLIRAICEDVGLPMTHMTKDFIDYPLAPPKKEGVHTRIP